MSEQQQRYGAPGLFSLLLAHLLFLALISLERYVCGIPKRVDAFLRFCMFAGACVFVIKILAGHFYGSLKLGKKTHFVVICPHLNQSNTVLRVGEEASESFAKYS